MFSIEADPSKRLVVINYRQHVTEKEMEEAARQVREMVTSFEPGFRVLTDLRWLDSMEPGAARYIADIMDAVAERQVSMIVRVIPDPRKDIGLNILSFFHYDDQVKIATVETLAEGISEISMDLK